jgi:hypothetical protein
MFAANARSVAALRTTLAAAKRRDAGGVIGGLGRFGTASARAHALSAALGIRCS